MCNHSAHLPASVPTSKMITEYLLLATNSLWLSNDVGLVVPFEVGMVQNFFKKGLRWAKICYGQRGNDAVPKSKDWCSILSVPTVSEWRRAPQGRQQHRQK